MCITCTDSTSAVVTQRLQLQQRHLPYVLWEGFAGMHSDQGQIESKTGRRRCGGCGTGLRPQPWLTRQ